MGQFYPAVPGDERGPGTPTAGREALRSAWPAQDRSVSRPQVHGSQVHGLQLQSGLAQAPVPPPQLQSTQVQGSQVQFGLEQVVGSVVVIGGLLGWRVVWSLTAAPSAGLRPHAPMAEQW